MKQLNFPENFLWGTATSAHQVEGGNKNNDWWEFEKQGKVKNGEISGLSCNHYNRFEEDFELLKKLNNNAHRLSIEWSRIEPEEDHFNLTEIGHYQKVLESLKNKNIKTMVTLHHFTNPLWMAKQGGWENKEIVNKFEKYTQCIVKYLGQYIDFWITLNEPVGSLITHGYIQGYWPPEQKSLLQAKKVLKNLIIAHKKSYQKIHAYNPISKIGIAELNNFFEPYNKNSLLDKFVVKVARYIGNFYFLDKIKNHQDFIGLNYYFHDRIKFNLLKTGNFFFEIKNEDRETSDLGWEIYPQGIYKVLKELKKYNLPIYITENGLADAKDKLRSKFILEHLKYVWKAIKEGVDVKGYFHWSALDNFEWKEGFSPHFGLIEVDYKTFRRTPRKSAFIYSEICKQSGITEEIVKKYQPGLLEKIFKE